MHLLSVLSVFILKADSHLRKKSDTLDGLSDMVPIKLANNEAFRIEENGTQRPENGGKKMRAANRKLRHDSKREQPKDSSKCCSS